MAAVNFPDPADSPWTNPDNGVTYIYDSGVWKVLSGTPSGTGFVKLDDGGSKQVIQSAGIGISDGTDEKITLGANGTLSFEDVVGLKVQFNGTASNYYGISKLAGSTDLGDGELRVTAGHTGSGGEGSFTVYTGPNERLRIDNGGTTTFAGDVISGRDTADGIGVKVRSSGSVVVREDSGGPVLQAFNGSNQGSDRNVQIKSSGEAYFADKLTAGTFDIESLDSLP